MINPPFFFRNKTKKNLRNLSNPCLPKHAHARRQAGVAYFLLIGDFNQDVHSHLVCGR